MKKYLLVLITASISLFIMLGQCTAEIPTITELTLTELNQLRADIDQEIKIHHSMNSDIENDILNVVKSTTEDYYNKKGIKITWARFGWDYSYHRDTDFFGFSSHINYRDSNNRNQKVDVVAFLYYDGDSYEIYRLNLNNEQVIAIDIDVPDSLLINESNVVIMFLTI